MTDPPDRPDGSRPDHGNNNAREDRRRIDDRASWLGTPGVRRHGLRTLVWLTLAFVVALACVVVLANMIDPAYWAGAGR